MNTIIIVCFYCRKEFSRDTGHINENKKLGHKYYCSLRCFSLSRTLQTELLCDNPICNKKFRRRHYAVSAHNYCSRSCAASVNNAKFPKNPGIKKLCIVCNKQFVSREKYCSVLCRNQDRITTKEIIIELIKKFYRTAGRIPLKKEFAHARAARDRFGTWNNAIIAAGFPPNPVKFAKKYIASDGHKCDSLAEKIIDDWLNSQKIDHMRGVAYPGNTTLTVDFVIKDFWIEFFGLFGEHVRYDELREEKLQLAKQYNLKFIAIYPKHLFPMNNLPVVLASVLSA